MTATCQNCTAPSRDAFLCRVCTKALRQMLADLPWFIDRLAEAAIGDVRMSADTSHGYRTRYTINGEHNVAHYLACFPGNVDELPDDKALGRRYDSARRAALAAGGVNERASDLMDAVNNTLTTIVRDLCETRGVQPQIGRNGVPLNASGLKLQSGSPYRTALLCARWLALSVSAITADDGAGRTYADIHSLVGDERRDGRITRAINRPIPIRDLGRCPTWNEGTRKACGNPLSARADMIEVYCRICRQTHKTDRLQLLLINDLARAKVTTGEILRLNKALPEDYRIPEGTLRRWQSSVKGEPPRLKTRGFLRPCSCGHASKHHVRYRAEGCSRCDCAGYDGREVINRHSDDDEVLYLWPDIQKLRAEQWKVAAS